MMLQCERDFNVKAMWLACFLAMKCAPNAIEMRFECEECKSMD